jgi:hypothetical protein
MRLVGRSALCLASLLLLSFSSSALARTVVSWDSSARIDGAGLAGLSCPSNSLCVAVDRSGNVVVSTDPAGQGAPWNLASVDGSTRLSDVSCPSPSLCVAVDQAGNVLTSGKPTGGTGSWSRVQLETTSINSISCPSVSLCVAVDSAGDVLTSTQPVGGSSAWSIVHVDDALNYECYHYRYTGPNCQAALLTVSCPSTSLCLATDESGDVISSHNPTGGKAAWSDGRGGIPASEAFNGLSCPTVSLCAAVDNYGGEVSTWNPSNPPWTPSTGAPGGGAPISMQYGLADVWCVSSQLCFVVDYGGDLWLSEHPTGGSTAWSVTLKEDGSYPSSLACPSPRACIAVDWAGNRFIGKVVHTGELTGAIRRSGGPAPLPGHPRRMLGGMVSVFAPTGRLVARHKVAAGHRFRFSLVPGRYLINAGTVLHPKHGCPPRQVIVRADRTTHAEAHVGCNIS